MLPLIPDLKAEAQTLWMKSQILWKNSVPFNVAHRKVDWRNPKSKSLYSMPHTTQNQLVFGKYFEDIVFYQAYTFHTFPFY